MKFDPVVVGVLCLLVGCSSSSTKSLAVAEEEAPKPDAAARVKPTREGSDWPQFLGPNGDGSSPEKGILTAWPKEGLTKKWDCDLGVGYAPPIVVNGRLFHFGRFENTARLSCRNAETGELVWKFEYPTEYEDFYGYDPGPRACPIVDGERVYIHGVEGMIHCLKIADGSVVWKLDAKEKYHFHQNFFGVGSVPLIEGDLLIVAIGGSEKGPRPADLRDAKGNGSAIVAFDKTTGEEKYRFGDELASYSSPIIVTLHKQRVGLYFARGGLLGFDPKAGKQLFHFPYRARLLESVNAANPVVVGDQILLTECYEKGAILLKVGADWKVKAVWNDDERDRFEKAMMGHWCTPILDGTVFYGCTGRHTNEGEIRCVDFATGDVKWAERRTTRCTFTKIDGHLLSLAETGELRLIKLNAAKYEEVASFEVPGITYPAWAPPVVSRGLVYIRGKKDEKGSEGHRLVCFELMKK